MADAHPKLLAILPTLRSFELVLHKIAQKFEPLKNYEKKLHYGEPSLVPIKEFYNLVEQILKIRKKLIEFKKSFDENELDKEKRKIFLEIFVEITKKNELVKPGKIILGNGRDLWHRSIEDVILKWDNSERKKNYAYSLVCYKFIKEYLPLAQLINKLDEGLYS